MELTQFLDGRYFNRARKKFKNNVSAKMIFTGDILLVDVIKEYVPIDVAYIIEEYSLPTKIIPYNNKTELTYLFKFISKFEFFL